VFLITLDTSFLDTVGDPETYKSRLTRALGDDFGRFTIEKKADALYKVVSAASIIAKVTRDTLLKSWTWAEPTVTLDKSFGSGYPGDENCVKW
jgi:ribonuclease H2 subunit A